MAKLSILMMNKNGKMPSKACILKTKACRANLRPFMTPFSKPHNLYLQHYSLDKIQFGGCTSTIRNYDQELQSGITIRNYDQELRSGSTIRNYDQQLLSEITIRNYDQQLRSAITISTIL